MSERGQALIEIVLLMGVVILVWTGAIQVLRRDEFFQKVFGEPWARLSSTIEFGVPGDRRVSGAKHPATLTRHSTRKRD